MSSIVTPKAETQAEIRRQLEALTEPHTTSRQALGDPSAQNHNDGEYLHKHFSIPPLHKYLAKADRQGSAIATFPRAFVDPLVYTDDRDLELLRGLSGEVEYDFRDPNPSHEALERYGPYRAKVLEWIADEPHRVRDIRAVKGTDTFIHGEPGGGKSTLALSLALWRMEVNNETVIWAETADESGTNERAEWLPFAPFATLVLPAGMDTTVRIEPEHHAASNFEVAPEEIARDVIRYESIQDLLGRLQPGQFYVVFPDPLHRGADEVSKFNYFSYEDVRKAAESDGDGGPSKPTDADQWWFAFIAHRISGDVFVHPTYFNFDEAGNVFDPDAGKDIHEFYQKNKWYREKYADARKKAVSVGYQTHALSELNTFARQKIRWRLTMNGNAPPIGRTLPGDRRCPIEQDITSDMTAGEAVIWKAPNFAEIRWPNLKADARLDAEISIEFRNWQRAIRGER